MEDENKNEVGFMDYVNCMLYGAGFLCFFKSLYDLFGDDEFVFSANPLLMLITGVTCIAGAIIMSMPITTKALERQIRNELREQGYKYQMYEGTLYVTKNDNHFHIHLINTPNRRLKRLYIYFDFEIEDFEKVSHEGWGLLSNEINQRNPHTAFIAYKNQFSCRYTTAINNSDDFMTEFRYAYNFFSNIMKDYDNIYPYVERDFPNSPPEKNSNIGFMQKADNQATR